MTNSLISDVLPQCPAVGAKLGKERRGILKRMRTLREAIKRSCLESVVANGKDPECTARESRDDDKAILSPAGIAAAV